MLEFLNRLLGRRRPAPTPEPELPQQTYLEALADEIRGLHTAAEFYAGTRLETPLRAALASAQDEFHALTTPEVAA